MKQQPRNNDQIMQMLMAAMSGTGGPSMATGAQMGPATAGLSGPGGLAMALPMQYLSSMGHSADNVVKDFQGMPHLQEKNPMKQIGAFLDQFTNKQQPPGMAIQGISDGTDVDESPDFSKAPARISSADENGSVDADGWTHFPGGRSKFSQRPKTPKEVALGTGLGGAEDPMGMLGLKSPGPSASIAAALAASRPPAIPQGHVGMEFSRVPGPARLPQMGGVPSVRSVGPRIPDAQSFSPQSEYEASKRRYGGGLGGM